MQPVAPNLCRNLESGPPGRPGGSRAKTSDVRQNDFAVLDLDQIDAGFALAAFLSGRAGLLEFDLAVHPHQLDLPEGRADGFGLGLARLGNRGRDCPDAVIAAEALGQSCERIAAL